ncbi:hypothetical protein AAFF_G00083920 [Aldrovandia affinis]|uniref:Inward rectifier potassium channel C-terminal domain-containing protein n=1 Tax=Aldrovandia affinis TaxID=143900 RepID=A0AAD7RWY7_9TELE|nr:hypothetical protein AAFF_G00083920 [Aldrovandia affinis]
MEKSIFHMALVEPQVIQHSIDPSSPFWELGPNLLWRQQFQIIVILEGILEAAGKTTYRYLSAQCLNCTSLCLSKGWLVTKQAPLPVPSDCCAENGMEANGTCVNNTHCEPGCYLRILENDTTTCMLCDSPFMESDNISICNYIYVPANTNITTFTTVTPKIGGPGVVTSLLLGTLLVSLFLILSVASFFYLKRSNRLPGIFYRRNKAFIFQPSETAVMIPTPASSVRKPRYVRRERPPTTSVSTAPTISTTAVTKVPGLRHVPAVDRTQKHSLSVGIICIQSTEKPACNQAGEKVLETAGSSAPHLNHIASHQEGSIRDHLGILQTKERRTNTRVAGVSAVHTTGNIHRESEREGD